jgi:peptidoglycan/xylan/chitin deacetylase (PgdA/CDA1 family)
LESGHDERRGEGRTRHLVARVPRRHVKPQLNFVCPRAIGLVAGLFAISLLVGCAAGSPSVASDPTSTHLPPTETIPPTATASPTSTVPPVTVPTEESPLATPSPETVNRPEPPPEPGEGEYLVVDRGTSGRMEVALTFDAGADRGYAEEILDILEEAGVKASFGITGHWADENPELVQRMVADGHMIFNHTYSHRSWTGFSTAGFDEGVLTTDERTQELSDTEIAVDNATGGYELKPYYRPPYGDYDEGVLADLKSDGYYVVVMWTCDSFGWNGASVDEIIDRCGTQASPGDIILMHVGADSLDSEALPGLIETLKAQGYDLVTVEELLQP